jgi:hypothetical protein
MFEFAVVSHREPLLHPWIPRAQHDSQTVDEGARELSRRELYGVWETKVTKTHRPCG